MPLTRLSRASVLRAAAVVLITTLVGVVAACSDEDTVDTIPPPWPSPTSKSLDEGPQVPSMTGTTNTTATHTTTRGRTSTTSTTGR